MLRVKQPGIESWAPYMGGLYQKTRSKSATLDCRTVIPAVRLCVRAPFEAHGQISASLDNTVCDILGRRDHMTCPE
jgi:hypothetical protein